MENQLIHNNNQVLGKLMEPEFIDRVVKTMKLKIFFLFTLTLVFFSVGLFTNFTINPSKDVIGLVNNIKANKLFFVVKNGTHCDQQLVQQQLSSVAYWNIEEGLRPSYRKQNITLNLSEVLCYWNVSYSEVSSSAYPTKCWTNFYIQSNQSECPKNNFKENSNDDFPLTSSDYVHFGNETNTYFFYEQKKILKAECLSLSTILNVKANTSALYILSGLAILSSIISGYYAYLMGAKQKESDIVEKEVWVPNEVTVTKTTVTDKISGHVDTYYKREGEGGYWRKIYKMIDQVPEDKLTWIKRYSWISVVDLFLLAGMGSRSLLNLSNYRKVASYEGCFEDDSANKVISDYKGNYGTEFYMFEIVGAANVILFIVNTVFFYRAIKEVVKCSQLFSCSKN